MNDSVEVLNSVELDEMTRKAIGLVANEIEAKIRGNLQSALHEAAAKELAEVKSNVQVIESTLTEVEKRLLSEYRTRIDEVIAKQDEVVAKHQDVRGMIESTLAEVEKRLLSEQRTRIDEVEGKLVKTQRALLGLIAATLLATITGIFL